MALPVIDKPEDFEQFRIADLVEWHNANCSEHAKVKVFRTRLIAVNVCTSLFERLKEQAAFEEETADLTDEEFERQMLAEIGASSVTQENNAGAPASLVKPWKEELTPKKKEKGANSESVKKSWKDDDIHNRRTMRNHVFVTYKSQSGETREEFRSVREAFERLNLPHRKHIRFRKELKEIGEKMFEWKGDKYLFEVIERSR